MVSPDMRIFRLNSFLALLLSALAPGLHGRAETTLADSPFLPAKTETGDPRSASQEPFQLSAIGVVEGKTFVSIYEAAEKRSRWIAVGGSLGDLKIVSCDVDAEQAVVRIGGQLKTLTLPKPAVSAAAAAAPSPGGTAAGSAPAATEDNAAAVAPPATEEEQAREARMLVSDLLEIGMQQRKAYEDAQKKNAEQADKPPAAN